MKIKDWIKRVIFASLGLIGLTIVAFIIILFSGVYVGGAIVIGGIIFILYRAISEYELEQKRKQVEQEAEQQAEQKKQYYAEFLKLIDEYVQSPNHSAQEAKEAWEKYNSLLQMYGVEKDGPVFKIYLNVYPFLKKEIPNGSSAKSEEEQAIYYLNLAANLWNFYYQVAFTYELPPNDQEDLLRYLAQCFSGDEERRNFNHALHFSYGNLEVNAWNRKYLALWEKGAECGSVFAMCQLADCYYKLIIVDLKDFDKAFSLYQQAAQLGSMQAVYMLGQCYQYGRGTKINYQKAGDCYQYAYNAHKDPEFAKALGKLYEGQRWDKKRYSPDIFSCDMPVMKKANLEKLKRDVAKYAQIDIETADFPIVAASIRMTLEQEIVNPFVECYEIACLNDKLQPKITLLRKKGYFPRGIADKADFVRDVGNRGLHNNVGEEITASEMMKAISYIKEIAEYYEQY